MLKALVAALLIANLAFYGWSRGWLDDVVGIPARGDREPERLTRQVRPESIVILPPEAGAQAAAAPGCIEAGPYTAAQAASAADALRKALPDVTWRDVTLERPGVWTVYLGGFSARDAMLRKEDDLRASGIEYAETTLPGENEAGLALGRYDDRSDGEKALAQLQQRGIRGGRVLALAEASNAHLLRVERADAALASRLFALKLEALGRGFAACPAAARQASN